MIDIHCHLIFGVDDGSKSIEESISVLKGLADYGYTDIILTPHYISDSIYCSTKKQNMVILKKIEEALQQKKIKLNLYLGNEVFIDYHILSLLKEGKISTLNNSQYLLIELPMSGEFEGYEEVFMELIANGYQVILAHPERYLTFQKDFNKVYELEKLGILFQSNLDSIIGNYGSSAKKVVKRLLKEMKISFLATDIHHPKCDYDKWTKARKKALKYLTEEEYHNLVYKNPLKIIKS